VRLRTVIVSAAVALLASAAPASAQRLPVLWPPSPDAATTPPLETAPPPAPEDVPEPEDEEPPGTVPPLGAPEVVLGERALALDRQACERADPACDPVALLSRLERRAVNLAMRRRGLTFDRAPQGKRVRQVVVATYNVFGPGDGPLRLLNVFHATTRNRAVRRELQVVAGGTWDQRDVDESARRLRDPVSTSLVAIVPVRAIGGAPDEIDVLVVIRDVWSIRLNSNYEFSGEDLTKLSFSLSENNLFGMRKLLALSFRMDQGEYTVGPLFIDKNLAARHLDLRGIGGPVFNRTTRELEGSESTVTLARPLWTLDTKWGFALEWSHRYAINRQFRGTSLATYDASETPEDDMAPKEYHQRKLTFAATGTRGFGERVAQRLHSGWELSSVRPSLLETFPADPVLRGAFIRDVLPRSERTSILFVGWEAFEARYRNVQYMQTFELAEDTRMGFHVEATIGQSFRLLGATVDFLRLTGKAGYTGPIGNDGLWQSDIAATTRLENGDFIDTIAEWTARIASPSLLKMRVVTQLELDGLFRDTQNQYYTLGGDNGLRGFLIGEFEGDRRIKWQTELRTRPVAILFTRWGGILFHDLGGAADRAKHVEIHQDIGIGLRTLVPQLNREVFRLDLAYVIDRQRDPMLGRLHFTAGYEQSF